MTDATSVTSEAATAQEDAEAEAILADAVSRSDDEPDPAGAEALGDPGKKALQEMKERWRSERDRRKELEKRLAELTRQQSDGGQPDVEAIRRQAREEALAEAARGRGADQLEVVAAQQFADPEAAVALLLRRHAVDDFLDGSKVDMDAIRDALVELAEQKPHLVRRSVAGSFDSGRGRTAAKPQLSREDIRKLTPAQINQARREGRLDRLMGKV